MDQHDLWVAEMCRVSYDQTPGYIIGDARVHVFAMNETRKCVVLEGTKPQRLEDVVKDIDQIPEEDETLGHWPRGFLSDIRAVQYRMIHDLYGVDFELAGHSKGGAEASGIAAIFAAIGRPPRCLTTFGRPNCCGARGRALLSPIPGIDWAHVGDEVVAVVPFYKQGRDQKTFGTDRPGLFTNHHIETYIEDGAMAFM